MSRPLLQSPAMTPDSFCTALRSLQQTAPALMVGVTGGISVGKSTVVSVLAQRFPVLEADSIAKTLYQDPVVIRQLRQRCPQLFEHGALLPFAKIAEKVFADPALRRCVEQVLYPFVFDQLYVRSKAYVEQGANVVIHESALLVESKVAAAYAVLVTVVAPLRARLARIPEPLRPTWYARYRTQLPEWLKQRFAHYVVFNWGSREQLHEQAYRLMDWLAWQRHSLRSRQHG